MDRNIFPPFSERRAKHMPLHPINPNITLSQSFHLQSDLLFTFSPEEDSSVLLAEDDVPVPVAEASTTVLLGIVSKSEGVEYDPVVVITTVGKPLVAVPSANDDRTPSLQLYREGR